MKKMPLVFIGHGSPMNAIEHNEYTQSWIKIANSIPTPRAIVIFSAHWITQNETKIAYNSSPQMIYDMWGFPDELYRVRYDARADLELSQQIHELFLSNNINSKLDSQRGFDHGVWSVLMHMYPEAQIPVICISVDYRSGEEHLMNIGKSLRELRESGVLIMASGNIVHNLWAIDWSWKHIFDWAQEFDHRVSEYISNKNTQELLNYKNWWNITRLSHPTVDHFLPIFPLLWAVGQDDNVNFYTPNISMGSLSMRSVVWS